MPHVPIELKSSSFILSVIYIYDIHPDMFLHVIQNKIKKANFFLKKKPIVININNLNNINNWPNLYDAILITKLNVIGVVGCRNKYLKQEIIRSGLSILTENKVLKYNLFKQNSNKEKINNKNSVIINTPVRSGQQIYANNSDLIITNNISSGAEVIADGNIHIYGTINGRALAGASGDETCQIFCTCFNPELVSISGYYLSNDQISIEFIGKAVRLNLKNKKINIQYLNNVN